MRRDREIGPSRSADEAREAGSALIGGAEETDDPPDTTERSKPSTSRHRYCAPPQVFAGGFTAKPRLGDDSRQDHLDGAPNPPGISVTPRQQMDDAGQPLKVGARVRIPLGLPA